MQVVVTGTQKQKPSETITGDNNRPHITARSDTTTLSERYHKRNVTIETKKIFFLLRSPSTPSGGRIFNPNINSFAENLISYCLMLAHFTRETWKIVPLLFFCHEWADIDRIINLATRLVNCFVFPVTSKLVKLYISFNI